jgi:2'-5' RNA ligase
VSQTIRGFFAVELPEAVKAALGETMTALKKGGLAGSFPRPETIHLTLKFLGKTPESMVDKLRGAAQDALQSLQPFTLEAVGLGAFNPRSPRVMWAGIKGDTQACAQIARRVDAACAGLGFEAETRSFHPHLTLVRFKKRPSRDVLAWALEKWESASFGTFNVNEVVLFSSTLSSGGARHDPVFQVPLNG